MADWYVGQKIVCVDADDLHPEWNASGKLVLRAAYTIREIEIMFRKRAALRVEEIVCWRDENGLEPVFWSWRFRPLVSQDADISVFTSLLDDLPASFVKQMVDN